MNLQKCIEEVELLTGSTDRDSIHFVSKVQSLYDSTPIPVRVYKGSFNVTLSNEGIIIVAQSKINLT